LAPAALPCYPTAWRDSALPVEEPIRCRPLPSSRRSSVRRLFAPLALAALVTPASAQSNCADVQKHVQERRALVQHFRSLVGKGKRIEPKDACSLLTEIVANSAIIIELAQVNKESCHIGDQFIAGFKADLERAAKLRAQACAVQQKQDDLEKMRQRMPPSSPSLIIAGP
jgi:hypothetical protein